MQIAAAVLIVLVIRINYICATLTPVISLSNDSKDRRKNEICTSLQKRYREGSLLEQEYRIRMISCATKDTNDFTKTETAPDSISKNQINIFFIDNDATDNKMQAYNANKNTNEHTASRTDMNAGVHGFLLTATESKHANSRHELYRNPKVPEIKFRTESSSTLRTVASPLLVQNSVKTKSRQGHRSRRHAALQSLNFNGYKYRSLPQYRIDESWFKRYETLYNQMVRRSLIDQPKSSTPIQLQRSPTPLQALNNNNNYYRYVYPLYQLHTRDSPIIPKYNTGGNNMMQYRRAQIAQRRLLLQNNMQPQRYFINPQAMNTGINAGISTAQPVQTYKPVSRDSLQQIGLKDDGSFIEATPNFDRSPWTLNAIQSLIPKEQVRKPMLNSVQLSDISKRQQIRTYKPEMSTKYTLPKITSDLKQAAFPQGNGISTSLLAQRKDTLQRNQQPQKLLGFFLSSGAISQRNTASAQKPMTKQTILKSRNDQLIKQGVYNASKAEFTATMNALPINKQTVHGTGIVSKIINPLRRSRIASIKAKNVNYKDISPSTEVDADGVTAENLATIFQELDSETSRALEEAVTKKDIITKPNQDLTQIQDGSEGTVTDDSNQAAIDGAEKENNVYLEQKLNSSPMKSEIEALYRKGNFAKRFSLANLHYGIENGNMFNK